MKWIQLILFICISANLPLSFCLPDPYADGLNKEMEDHRLAYKQQEFMSLNSECISKKWYCQRECRFQFFENSGTCRIPTPEEHCFGMPIQFNYTWNKGIQRFPRELELLKRFPKCWSLLGPLICSSIYRPCSKNQYIEAAMKEPGFIEMWEVFPVKLCKKAMEECPFLIENGIWPEFLNCNNVVELTEEEEENLPIAHTPEQEQRLFTDKAKCTATNLEASIIFPPEQCLWPLVKGAPELAATKNAKPLIDACYLPCETPIAGFDWMLEGFRRRNSMIAAITGAVFLLITIYLMGFSKIYQTSLCVFCLAQSFLCITLYLTFWFISASKSIRSSVLCVDDGRIRRLSSLATLDPCALEAILSTFTLISANFWLCTLLLLRIFRPKNIRNDNYFIYGKRGNEMSARIVLAVIAYLGIPITLFILAFFLWHDLPVDPISGICHVGVGSPRHSLLLHGTMGIFCFAIVASSIWVAFQKHLQEHRLEKSFEDNDIESQTPKIGDNETLIKNNNEEIKATTNNESYVAEHGLGDSLFSDYWLGVIAVAFISTTVISTFIQYTIITDMGQEAEEQRIEFSIRCSLNSIKAGEEHHPWWNRTLNFDHQTMTSDPYLRKAALFNSATAPNCEIPLISTGQVFSVFLAAIILPSLPLWISAVCFFTGFCDHGLKSVRKVRRNLNPFIRESSHHRNHLQLDDDGHEMDTFLEQRATNPTKEDIEIRSQAAHSGFSAPARLQNISSSNAARTPHAFIATTNVPNEGRGGGSVHSEPIRESRKLDLNQKRLQHKKEKIQFLEHQKTQTKKLFAIPPPIPSQPQQPPSQRIQQQPPQPNLIDGMNNIFAFPSYENLGSQSSFNMTSVSQQLPYYPPPVNMELITKVQELTAQNNQLMGNNYKALDTITQLVESFNLMAYSIKFWSGNIAQQMPQPPPPEPSPHSEKEPPIARIPVKLPSSRSSGSSSNGGDAKVNGFGPGKPPQKRGKKKVPKIRIENVNNVGKAVTSEMINGTHPENIAPRIIDDTSEDDEMPPADGAAGGEENWFVANPPQEIYHQWNMLRQQFNQNNGEVNDPFQMSDEEIDENLLFRIVSHCGTFLPSWIFRTFRDSVAEQFDELYTEDEHRSETLNSLKLYPDTEPMEAAVEKKLSAYIWPLICRAIRRTSEEMYLNWDLFGTEKTEWIPTEEELQHFRTLMEEDDLSSESSDDEFMLEHQHPPLPRQPPDLEALAQERIDEVSEEEY